MTLSAVDFDAREEELYILLIDASPSTVSELRDRWSHGDDGMTKALASLVCKGFASVMDDGRYAAVAPDVALESVLLSAEQDLRTARQHVDTLNAAYRAHLAGPVTSVVESLSGGAAIEQRVRQLQQAARYELRCLGFAAPETLSSVRCRVIVRSDAAGITDGSDVSHLPEIPVQLVLSDERLGLLLLPGSESAVVVHPSTLFDGLSSLFESLWERAASPMTGARSNAGPDRLIDLLLSGITDQAIGRHLGVGHRTVQRRIAALMNELGARTRFQAGVQLALRSKATALQGKVTDAGRRHG